ncbi:MAG: TIGR02266 family protein [Myxococcus sp.]|nr:TIGR02266 family protein [Myxococcus sp.]
MTDQDVELSRREAEQAQEEANLHAELTRIMAATVDYERRLKQLKSTVAEAELNGAPDGHLSERVRSLSVPTLDAESAFGPAREERAQALEARRQAMAEVRHRITQFRAQIAQLGQTLTTDEKLAQRAVQQAKQAAAAKAEAAAESEAALGATMISAAPPPGLLPKAPPAPVPVPVPVPVPAAAAAKPEPKRQSPRVRMQAQVDFESDDNFFNGFSANISDGGVFIATVNVLPLGTSVDVGFTLPTGERIECKGVVRWVREIDDKQPDVFPGMGVQFVDLEARGAKAIENFIQQREPMFYVE